jgi:hypothetical protein
MTKKKKKKDIFYAMQEKRKKTCVSEGHTTDEEPALQSLMMMRSFSMASLADGLGRLQMCNNKDVIAALDSGVDSPFRINEVVLRGLDPLPVRFDEEPALQTMKMMKFVSLAFSLMDWEGCKCATIKT